MDKILAVRDQQFGIVGSGGKEVEIELIGTGIVAGVGQDRGQHAGDGGVGGVSGVELLQQRQRLGLVLVGEYGGELRR